MTYHDQHDRAIPQGFHYNPRGIISSPEFVTKTVWQFQAVPLKDNNLS